MSRRAHSFHNGQTAERPKPRKHATPSHSISVPETAAQYTRTYIGWPDSKVDKAIDREFSSARRQENPGLTLQSNWASPATKKNREYPDCSCSSFSNWACHPNSSSQIAVVAVAFVCHQKNHEFADCSCSPVAFQLGPPWQWSLQKRRNHCGHQENGHHQRR